MVSRELFHDLHLERSIMRSWYGVVNCMYFTVSLIKQPRQGEYLRVYGGYLKLYGEYLRLYGVLVSRELFSIYMLRGSSVGLVWFTVLHAVVSSGSIR